MKQLVAAVFTLTAIVAGIVLATSLSSSAQEDGTPDETPTTTIAPDLDRPHRFGFGFRFGGELPPELEELTTCLRDHGIDVPEEADGSFLFDLRSDDIEGLAEALEACGLPTFEDRFPFDGELPEGFPFGGELPEGFPFDGEFPEGFPFDGEVPDGFPFGEGFDFDFDFHHGPLGVDRDELASCLAELGSFDSVEEVRNKLDECLPAPLELGEGDLDGFEGFRFHGKRGFGIPFGGGHFGFDLDESTPQPEGTST